jgi:hypothetical protein
VNEPIALKGQLIIRCDPQTGKVIGAGVFIDGRVVALLDIADVIEAAKRMGEPIEPSAVHRP